MENKITIRINLEQREVELQGEASYIEETFGDYLKDYLDILKSNKPSQKNQYAAPEAVAGSQKENETLQEKVVPDSFGEYLNKFPKGLNNVDKLLIASYYAQMRNPSRQYGVQDASALLIEQGIKLSNPSAFNKLNENTKRVFKISGKNFRVSDTGIDYIKTL